MIDILIDKQDNFEIIRDQIASILAVEVASQMTLATDNGKNPQDWALQIYAERSNPWEAFLNDTVDIVPIVNVFYGNTNFNINRSNAVENQHGQATFYIDCYAFSNSQENDDGGHIPGDYQASLNVQKATRLVRNILMSANYTYLGLRGLVSSRFIENIKMLQPQENDSAMQNICASRIELSVSYNEFSPQITPKTLELITTQTVQALDGSVIFNANYTYPLEGE